MVPKWDNFCPRKLPLTLMDSSLWTPLGLVIIGGMMISTVVTLFIVSELYLLITRKTAESAQLEPV